jgi:hypothetical protein
MRHGLAGTAVSASRFGLLSAEAEGGAGLQRRHNVVMRGPNDQFRAGGSQSPLLQQRVQFSRGHWRREEESGAVRSAGWWEAVSVTWSPAATPGHRPSLWHRALATAVDTITPAITPVIADLVVARARHLLERQRGARMALSSPRRQLPTAARALPRSDQPR